MVTLYVQVSAVPVRDNEVSGRALKLGPSVESYLQSLAYVACSTSFVDCSV